MSTESNETTAVAVVPKVDNGKPALFNPAVFDQVWRAAKLFSASDLVPVTYKGKPENCFIAIEMAERMGVNPFAVMQNLAIIQGKPAMEAKLIIALVNDSGMFVDPIEYEVVGDDPHADNYKVRAFATMAKTGKLCLGPWITWKMVKGEGWLSKGGSKWATMPSIMFMYRAASFFAKVYAPNITMGMQTREEMEDVREPVDITPRTEAPPLLPETPVVTGKTVVVEAEHGTTAPPARKRGEPSPGNKKRTKAEMEEDRQADERDRLAAQQQAQQPPPAQDACPHPEEAQYQEGEAVMCGACGERVDGGDVQEAFPDLVGPDPHAEQQQAEEPTAAPAGKPTVPDLF